MQTALYSSKDPCVSEGSDHKPTAFRGGFLSRRGGQMSGELKNPWGGPRGRVTLRQEGGAGAGPGDCGPLTEDEERRCTLTFRRPEERVLAERPRDPPSPPSAGCPTPTVQTS